MNTTAILHQEAHKANTTPETPQGYTNALLDAARNGQTKGWEYALHTAELHAEGHTNCGTGYARGAAYAAQIINETT